MTARDRSAYAAWSTDDLFRRAVETDDQDEYEACVMELHGRGSPDTFAKALAFCKDGSGVERRVGAVVLAQLGYAEGYPFRLASIPILLRMFEDTDVSALEGAAHAFAYIRAQTPLTRS